MKNTRFYRPLKLFVIGATLSGVLAGIAACKEALIGGAGAAVGYTVARSQESNTGDDD